MIFATDFADPALILSLLLVVALTAAACGWWRGAIAWLGVSGATLGLVAVVKVLLLASWAAAGRLPFSAAAAQHDAFMLRSPSGHTASAVVAYGGLAMILGMPRRGWVAIGVLAGIVMGSLRVMLSFHSVAESVVGAALGLAGVLVMARAVGPRPRRATRWAIAVTGFGVIIALHGQHLRIEHLLEVMARRLAHPRSP